MEKDLQDDELLVTEDDNGSINERLKKALEEKERIHKLRTLLSHKVQHNLNLLDDLQNQANLLKFEYNSLQEYRHTLELEKGRVRSTLHQLKQINVLNDAFYIWHAGPFATINNFRLGKLPSHQVDWTETNAALGQAAFIVSAIASKSDLEFNYYGIYPMGSFAKIFRNEDNSYYNLYTDASFSIFPKKNFNIALVGFLNCVKQLGDHVMAQDPTLQLPYVIETDINKVNDLSILSINGNEDQWTKALKYLLTDIKWIIAWATKHLNTSKHI